MAPSLSAALDEQSNQPNPTQAIGVPGTREALVGRDVLVAALAKKFAQSNQGVKLSLFGKPGVGKSAIALAAVDILLPINKWSTIVWLDFDRRQIGSPHTIRTGAIMDYDAATRDVAIGIGAGAALRETPERRATLLNKKLSIGRHLIVADNIDEETHGNFLDFLARAPRSVDVLTTSIAKLNSADDHQRVEPLSETETAELFAKWTNKPVSDALKVSSYGIPRIVRLMTNLLVGKLKQRRSLVTSFGSRSAVSRQHQWRLWNSGAAQMLRNLTRPSTPSPSNGCQTWPNKFRLN